MTIYLQDVMYLNWQSFEMKNTNLAVEQDMANGISFLTNIPPKENLQPEDILINCDKKLVTKSFACGHHHIYSALARGMPAPEKTPENFSETLEYIWWRMDRLLDMEMIRASALVTALFCLKNGVTFVIDHHSSPFAIEGSLETIAKAFDDMGISHLLCYEMSDRDGELSKENGLDETERYLESGRQGHVGLHASFTVSDELLNRAVALANKFDAGLHVHVAEDAVDQENCMREHKKRVIQRYADAGVLDLNKSILSHCIHLGESEINQVRDSKSWVVQNTESNLNNNVGVTDYKVLGENIMLGTDGMHSDMLRSAKAVFLTGQPAEGIDMSTVYKRFRNVHRYIQENDFQGDGDNNLVILDYDSPTDLNEGNFLGHFIYGLEARHVDSVVSSGRLVYHNRKLLTMDEKDILSFSREMANKLWDKMK
ncbi:amidohydrolase family protein [Thermodesulfobacteriota bacterium]